MSETSMSTKGQVVIPVDIRRALGLDRNTRLRVEREGERIVLTPIRSTDWRALRGCLAGETDLLAELEADRRADRG